MIPTKLLVGKGDQTSEMILASSFGRFEIYAPYVNHLELSIPIGLIGRWELLGLLRTYAQIRPLLPNLISLLLSPRHPYIEEEGPILADLIETLISSSMERVDLYDAFRSPNSLELIPNRIHKLVKQIIAECPNLSYLSLCYTQELPQDVHQTTIEMQQSIPSSLTDLKCHKAILCQSFYTWLASMVKLQQLELNQLTGTCPRDFIDSISSQSHGFELRHLTLSLCTPLPTLDVCRLPIVRHLTHLMISFGCHAGWKSSTITSLFDQLAASSPNLYSLSINGVRLRQAEFPACRLTRMSSLPLRKISLTGVYRDSIGGLEEIVELIQTWPTLRSLDLNRYQISYEELEDVLPFCGHLLMLRMCIQGPVTHSIMSRRFTPPQVVAKCSPFKLVSYPMDKHDPLEVNALARYVWDYLRPIIVTDLRVVL
ncbi:hypothetical protein RhiJN_18561 [Ceratobasidium sp. AG-Ba]|nr:hypothetical protein RhiJN_18561 [Ceratobasidium sp. AG-Ba]